LCLYGEVTVSSDGGNLGLRGGQSAFLCASATPAVLAGTVRCTARLSAVPPPIMCAPRRSGPSQCHPGRDAALPSRGRLAASTFPQYWLESLSRRRYNVPGRAHLTDVSAVAAEDSNVRLQAAVGCRPRRDPSGSNQVLPTDFQRESPLTITTALYTPGTRTGHRSGRRRCGDPPGNRLSFRQSDRTTLAPPTPVTSASHRSGCPAAHRHGSPVSVPTAGGAPSHRSHRAVRGPICQPLDDAGLSPASAARKLESARTRIRG
jgi:hypothetical protein